MSTYQIIERLPGACQLVHIMEQCHGFLWKNRENPSARGREEMRQTYLMAADTLRPTVLSMEIPWTEEMNAPDSTVSDEAFADWRNGFWKRLTKTISAILEKKFLLDIINARQLPAETVELFLKCLGELPAYDYSLSLIWLSVSECCRMTAPELSFKLAMDALRKTPDLLKFYGKTTSGYRYAEEQMALQHEFRACPICGGRGEPFCSAPSWRMVDFSAPFIPAKLWMRCKTCGNLYSRYFPEEQLRCGDRMEVIRPDEMAEIEPQFDIGPLLRSWCDILCAVQKYTDGDELLEVGIGRGHLIAVALEMGFRVDCVEISENTAHLVADTLKTPVVCGDFLAYPENKTYSVITLGDVLEHLSDPRAGLEKACRMLKDDGVIWISTPNYESAYNRLLGLKTAMWNEPHHVTYFNRRGLENLLHDVGLESVDYRVSQHYNGSMEILARKGCTR